MTRMRGSLAIGPLVLASLVAALGVRADQLDAAAGAEGAQSGKTSKFLRIRRDKEDEPVALETAITRYVSMDPKTKGLTVDLIAAVHVADKGYYDKLNELFKSYDAVLYELVAPEGTRVVPGKRRSGGNPVSFMQTMMKNVLKLEFQLDRIDYSRPNLVHADMSPKQFAASMKDRGESFLSMFMRIMGQSMKTQATSKNANADMELLVALVATDRSYRLKRLMAEQFENMETHLAALDGPGGSTIITGRNERAFEVLRGQIDKGKRRLAVFYGAGHLPDMEKRLIEHYRLKRQSQRWLEAWSITRPVKRASDSAAPIPAAAADR